MLPALTLALAEWPGIMRVLRSDMITTLQEDYIAMAKAKGLKPARMLFVHALKPSSLTLVTVTGIEIGRLIGGALMVEKIFALPGIGRLLVGAIYARDFIILQGAVLFVAAGFVIVNFIVDLLYAVLDPDPSWPRLTSTSTRRRARQPGESGGAARLLFGWRSPGSVSCSPGPPSRTVALPIATEMGLMERLRGCPARALARHRRVRPRHALAPGLRGAHVARRRPLSPR